MRVLFIDCAPFFGGAQASLLGLMEDLRRRHHLEIQLVAADDENAADAAKGTGAELRRRAVALGIPCHGAPCRHWQRSVSGLMELHHDRSIWNPLLDKVLHEFQPDVVQLNGFRPWLLLPKSLPDCPIILHDRDIRIPKLLLPVMARQRRLQVIAISDAVAAKWGRVLPSDRCHLIPNGLPLEAIRSVSPATLPFTSAFTVIQAADFVKWKRHGLFLDAMAEAHRQDSDIKAVIKGRLRDGAGEQLLDSLRSRLQMLHLEDAVALVADDGAALPWIAAADLLCSCSDDEPFGRVLVEAMAMGRPVVATRGAGHSFVLEGCAAATLTEPTPAALAAAILSWRDETRRRQQEAAARQRAARFSQEACTDAVCKLYDKLLLCNKL